MGWLTGKLIGFALSGLILTGASIWILKSVQNYFVEKENLQTQLANAEARAMSAEVSLGALRQTVELRDAHAREVTAIRIESQDAINVIRTKAREDMGVLEDRERFNRVTIAKPKLVERLANNATRKVFDDLESTINQ